MKKSRTDRLTFDQKLRQPFKAYDDVSRKLSKDRLLVSAYIVFGSLFIDGIYLSEFFFLIIKLQGSRLYLDKLRITISAQIFAGPDITDLCRS